MTGFLNTLAIGFLAVSATASNAGQPVAYPDFPIAAARAAVIVARISPGSYFPAFPECAKPDIVCLDPPPFWFKARLESRVFGDIESGTITVSTTSHYGLEALERAGTGPFLIALQTDGKQYRMPRYAMAELTSDRKGRLYVLILRKEPIHWLPCSVSELRREISPADFPDTITLDAGESAHFADRSPELFRKSAAGPVPRYAIAVADIGAHLKAMAPDAVQMACTKS